MKAFVSLAVLGLAVAWSGSAFAQFDQDKMMAEMKKCAVCKNLETDQPSRRVAHLARVPPVCRRLQYRNLA